MGLSGVLCVGLTLGTLSLSTAAGAAGPTWPERLAREKPRMIRAIEGIPGPAGYELENHYDGRRLVMGGLGLGLGEALQLLTVQTDGIEAPELVPCVGLFLGDYDAPENGYVHARRLLRGVMAVPVCTLVLVGGIELGRGLADVRPVWVRSARRAPSFVLTGAISQKDASIRAIGRF